MRRAGRTARKFILPNGSALTPAAHPCYQSAVSAESNDGETS